MLPLPLLLLLLLLLLLRLTSTSPLPPPLPPPLSSPPPLLPSSLTLSGLELAPTLTVGPVRERKFLSVWLVLWTQLGLLLRV